jgi:RHS repeat-associated protein
VRSTRGTWRTVRLIALVLGACLAAPLALAQTAYTTWYSYSAGGQLTGEILPSTGSGYPATRNIYNTAGLLQEVDKGSLSTVPPEGTDVSQWATYGFSVIEIDTYGYDSMGRVIWKEEASSGGTVYALTEYSYDPMSRIQCVATRMNPSQGPSGNACALSAQGSYGPDRITYTTYDAQNHPVDIYRAYGTADQQHYAHYEYTSNGLASTIADANNNLTTLQYDGYDRLSATVFPSKSSAGSSDPTDEEQCTYYDNDDNCGTRVTRDGQTIGYSYDELNRLIQKQRPDESIYYAYDLQGHRLEAAFSPVTPPSSEDCGSTSQGVSNCYDGFGEMTSETVDLGGISRTMSYEYDADGNRSRVTYPDPNYIGYTYDGGDRLNEVLENGSTTLATYTDDAYGRLQQLARGGGVASTTFGYDPLSRLGSLQLSLATSQYNVTYSLGYNPADQITSETISYPEYDPLAETSTQGYSVNGLNEYAGTSFSYDGRGNLTFDGSTTYSYDVENHLTKSSAHSAILTYDPLGRLYEVSSDLGTTVFLYDGDRITAEYDGSGNLVDRYVYGTAGDDPIVWYKGSAVGSSSRNYLFADHEGSITAMTDAAGDTWLINDYDPYGVREAADQGRFGYTGQAYIPEVGLYYYKARMYDAALGRFMQTDPVGYKDDLDLYAYVGNDPMDRTDPTGEIAGIDDAAEGTVLVGALAVAGVCYFVCPSVSKSIIDDGKRVYTYLESRSKRPDPLPEAEGRPHSIPDKDGGYTTHGPRDPKTGNPESEKQYRPTGKSHGDVPRPNVKERLPNTRPDGARVPGKPVVRPPTPDEIRPAQLPQPPKMVGPCSENNGCN